jgi:hypothetical protein
MIGLADQIAPPRQERPAPVQVGEVFTWRGCMRRVVRTFGEDAAAPVIVEEMTAVGHALPGQYGLWSAESVRRAKVEGSWL